MRVQAGARMKATPLMTVSASGVFACVLQDLLIEGVAHFELIDIRQGNERRSIRDDDAHLV